MYAVVIDPLSGYDTGTPSGWMATNALMAANDPRFAGAFWDAIDEARRSGALGVALQPLRVARASAMVAICPSSSHVEPSQAKKRILM